MIVSNLVNIASSLDVMAELQPNTLAIVFPAGRDSKGRVSYTHLTYRQLAEESDFIARGLEMVGIRRGSRAVLMVKPCLEFFSLAFALFKSGIVPVLIDPGIGIASLKTCIDEAEPEAFIGIPKAHVARKLLGWGKNTIKKNIVTGKFPGCITLDQVIAEGKKNRLYEAAKTEAEDTAAILFTSGSTGIPKGVVYNHGNFAAQVEKIRSLYNIKPGEIDLPTFPPFALFDPALGMTTIIPDMDPTRPAQVDPRKIIEAVENFGVTNMFGSPALINTVGRYGAAHNIKLPSLKRVVSAGAPVPAKVLEKFSEMLSPEAQIFTPYGATECLPVSSIGSKEIIRETRELTDKGAGVCIGRPVEGMEVSIIAVSDEVIPNWSEELKLAAGQIGEIVVKGPTVTRSYFNRDRNTILAKIYESGTKSLRHRMGDLGYFDEKGRIWFCGRKTQRVIAETGTFYTIPCEAVFNVHPAVYRSALVSVSINEKIKPVICVELTPEAKKADVEAIRKELLVLGAVHPHTSDIKHILFHPSFPVDIRHNAKIFREKLAVWAQKEIKKII
jgi:acyl-CoA synthetase (AMP-forming)/AMP-acid ligase II